MLSLNIFRSRKEERSPKQQEIDQIVLQKHRRAINRERVYRTIANSPKPVNMRTVASLMGADSGSISPRIAELRKKDRIVVAYTAKPINGVTCNYYKAVK